MIKLIYRWRNTKYTQVLYWSACAEALDINVPTRIYERRQRARLRIGNYKYGTFVPMYP